MPADTPQALAAEAPAVELHDVWFSYDGPPVLRAASLRVDAGEFVSMIGPNGGGKTTLVRLLLGLLSPDRGRVRVFGHAPERARSLVGYVPQYARFDPRFPVNVRDVVLMGRLGRTSRVGPFRRADRRAAAEAMDEVGLARLARRPFEALSGGQRQLALIARALAGQPRLLLLDEPTSNLDVRVQSEFYDLLVALSRRMTVLLVSHDVGFVTRAVSKVACIRQTIAVHPTAEVTGEMMRSLYGHDVQAVRHDHDLGPAGERPAGPGAADPEEAP